MLERLKSIWACSPQPIKNILRSLRYRAICLIRGPIVQIDYRGCRFDVQHQRLEQYQCARAFSSFEPDFLDCFLDKARTAKVVFDIGSYIGTYSLAAAAVNPNADVIAFEPQPENYQAIRANVAHNGFNRVKVYSVAVGDQNSSLTFSHVGQTGSIKQANAEPRSGETKQIVESVTLDALVQRDALPIPDLLKIDVEGYEAHVLRGMRGILEQHHPTILLELHPSLMHGFSESADELLAILVEMGYEQHVLHIPGDSSSTRHKQHHLLFECAAKRSQLAIKSVA